MSRPPAGDAAGDRATANSSDRPRSTRRRLLAGLCGVGVVGSIAGCGGRDPSTETAETPARDADTDPGPAPEPLGPWPQVRADAGNTGVAPAAGPTADPSLRWTATSAGTVGAFAGGAVGVGIYVAGEDGRVATVGPDGEIGWRTAVAAARFPPAVGSDRVVVPERERLSVLDAETGDRRRSVDVSRGVLGTPTVADGTVLAGSFGGGVVAADLETGSQVWRAGDSSRAYPPTVVDGTAYVTARRWNGDGDGTVAAVDLDSGEVAWTADLDAGPTAPPGVHDGVVYAGTRRGRVHAIDAADGRQRWRESVGDWVTRGPVAAVDGIYAVILGEGIVKLASDGAVAWRSTASGQTNPVLTDDIAVVGTDGGVVAVGRDGGETRWRVDADAGVDGDVYAVDRRVYAGDRHGTVHAIDARSGERAWRLPFRPSRMPGPVVGSRTIAGGSRDGGTYELVATDGSEFPVAGGAATAGLTPAVLDGRDLAGDADAEPTGTSDGDLLFGDGTRTASDRSDGGEAVETVLGGGTDGSLFRAPTPEYAEAPTTDLPATPTPTPTPGPDEPTATPTPYIDLPQREPVWETRLDVGVRSPVTYAGGVAYLGTETGVVGIDSRDGEIRWRVEVGDAVDGAPAVGDGRVFAVTQAGQLVGVAPGGGADVEWTVDIGTGSGAGPAVADGTVFVAGNDGRVAAYATDGTPEWDRPLDAGVPGGPTVTDAHVVVGTDAAAVVGIDRDDGTVAWRRETPGAVRATPAVAGGADPTVYVADHAGTLSAVDAADGSVRFRLAIGRWLDAPPAVGHGAVFVADGTGRVYAVVD